MTTTPEAPLRLAVVCARCGGAMPAYSTDTCWLCKQARLCPACWKDPGTCPACEADAAEIQRRLTERRNLLRREQLKAGVWTTEKAAAYLGVCRATVLKYAPLFCVGRKRLYRGYYSRWEFSELEVERLGEALKILAVRKNPEKLGLMIRPPWPEWLRLAWAARGMKPR